ncbi:taste receptor type 2 member 8-like [Perca fluviatilis]|uniref:taste receptor type 2 member 8-like n=1 Tax=Perca fluviatilis TaxID=8168 RepID=UPI0019623A66|nr:taste receptor type 2 member 8-like [Perca fluviatilis]
MTCSVWLNFYYYIQIVPVQRALLIWVKRNIKSVMYMILLFNGTFILFCGAVFTVAELFQSGGFTNISNTWTEYQIDGLYFTNKVCFFSINVYIFLCLCILMVSSFSTAHYLHRHIKRVAQPGAFFSTPRIQSQLRVTVTGISQGVLYFLYATFHFFDSFTTVFTLSFDFSAWFSFMFTSLYTLGTTVNLAIGQVIFRQRAVDVWKALKALCGVGMVTRDMKMNPSRLTTGETANTVTVDVQMSV